MTKCCGTCKLWVRDGDPPYCGWEEPKLPFWATIYNGDHEDYTEYEDGKKCKTYEPCEEE